MEKINIFFRNEMVPQIETKSFSKSPYKPKLILNQLEKLNLSNYFSVESNWNPFEKQDFEKIHDTNYVNDFFSGIKPICESNSIEWNSDFAETVKYTNASFYYSILNSIKNNCITLSPTSGFHHATPNSGLGFCTFAGQVLASCKIYEELNLTGAYIDLDGHFGNSIEDFKNKSKVSEIVNKAIKHNINPNYNHEDYIKDLKNKLDLLELDIAENKVHYIVFCHGADSHENDDGWNENEKGQCSTEEWVECSKIVYSFVKNMREKYKKYIPLSLALFGGYRLDDYNNVLNLHCKDLIQCLNIFYDYNVKDHIIINEPDFTFDLI